MNKVAWAEEMRPPPWVIPGEAWKEASLAISGKLMDAAAQAALQGWDWAAAGLKLSFNRRELPALHCLNTSLN